MKNIIKLVSVLNVKISKVTESETLAWIEQWIGKSAKKMVVTPNTEQVMLAQKNRSFRKILNGASLALADGQGLVWASRIMGSRGQGLGYGKKKTILRERVTGEEVMNQLIRTASNNNWKVFLLGGGPGTARLAAQKLQMKYDPTSPKASLGAGKLQIKYDSGAGDITRETREENKRVVAKINKFKPDLLFVAFGAPFQEIWLDKNLGKLRIKVGMVVGGALDMLVDPSLKPPEFMTSLGLDWLYRLLRQPWRIKRQLVLIKFVFLVLKKRFGNLAITRV